MNPDRLLQYFDRVAEAPDAVPRLRRFILDLAVRGKLVEQDPKDEPASGLLSIIEGEREELIKAGAIKRKEKTSKPPVPARDWRIPKSWEWVELQDIFLVISDGDHQPPPRAQTGIPFLVIGNVRNRRVELSADVRFVSEDYYRDLDESRRPRKGKILYTLVGSYGIPILLTDDLDFCVQRHIGILTPSQYLSAKYLARMLDSRLVFDQATECATGIAQKTVPLSGLRHITVPLPPIAEQYRIVAKVDDLMALCDELEAAQAKRERRRDRLVAASLHGLNNGTSGEDLRKSARFYLHHIPRLATRSEHILQLRQTILNLAVRGKLVSQDPEDEPVSKTLEEIERIRIHQTANGKIERQTKSPQVNELNPPFPLPPGWAWSRFPELGFFGRGRSKHRPRNDPTLFQNGSHPFVQTGDVARSKGVIRTISGRYNEVGLAQSAMWPKGTLCITIAANIADSGILDFDACFPDSVVGFVPNSQFSDARYFEYFVRTAKAHLHEFAPATAQKNINLSILNEVLIPLPPLAEQHRIVAKVDELMALCDKLEAELNIGETARARLLQATLHEALFGQSGNLPRTSPRT